MIYELDFDTENYSNFLPEGMSFPMMKSFDGRSHAKGWKSINYCPTDEKDTLPIPDFVSGYVPAISERASEVIKEVAADCVELLPCTLGKEHIPYYVMNVIRTEDCVNDKTSRAERFPSTGRIMLYEFIDLTTEELPSIFRISTLPTLHLFVNDKMKKALEYAGLTGCRFNRTLFEI